MKIGDSMFEKIKQLMTGNLSKGGRQVYIDDLRVIATVFVIGVHTVSLAATMTEYGSIPAFCHVKRSIIAPGKK